MELCFSLNVFALADFQVKTYRHDPNDPESPGGNHIYSLLVYDKDWLMLGTRFHGLNLFHKREERAIRFEVDPTRDDTLAETYIRCLFKDSRNRTWIGTDNGVLHLYNDDFKSFKKFLPEQGTVESPTYSSIFCIFEDHNHQLWLGRGEGLQNIQLVDEELQIRGYTEQDGLPNNSIYGILEDDMGFLWLSSNNGISRFDPVNERFRNYSFEDGLQNNEFNLYSYYKTRKGELLFGGVKGFNLIKPNEIVTNTFKPPVAFTEIKVNNRPVFLGPDSAPVKESGIGRHIRKGDKLFLSYGDRVLNISFAALSFSAPERNQFAYKLVGFDSDWVESGTTNHATYTSLEAGEYAFLVKAANNDGIWNEQPAELQILVAPPYWNTWWFRFIVLGTVTGALFLGHAWRTRMLKRHNDALLLEIEHRKKTEEQLQKSEERFAVAFHSSPDGIVVFRRDNGEIQEANQRFMELCQETRERLVGQNFFELPLWGNDSELMKTKLREESHVHNLKLRCELQNGFRVMLLSTKEINFDRLLCCLGIVVDITENVRLEERLHQAQKMDSIGFLAGGIAHDFNNILAGILGNAQLGVHFEKLGNKTAQYFKVIEQSALSAKSLAQQLLTFSKGGEPVKSDLDLAAVLRNSVELILGGKGVKVNFDIAPKLRRVHVDKAQINQVINNIVINAFQAMQQGGNLKVEAKNLELDEKNPFFLEEGFYVQISIEDDGPGIPTEILPKIFDPFFSTKKEGTGLGLATSYSIVEKHEGIIKVESELGVGSQFHILLPAVTESQPQKAESITIKPSTSGRILFMDDDPTILEFISEVFELFGYDAVLTENGEEAICPAA